MKIRNVGRAALTTIVLTLAVDRYTGWPTVVVTDRRLLVMDRGGKSLQRSVDPEAIDRECRENGVTPTRRTSLWVL